MSIYHDQSGGSHQTGVYCCLSEVCCIKSVDKVRSGLLCREGHTGTLKSLLCRGYIYLSSGVSIFRTQGVQDLESSTTVLPRRTVRTVVTHHLLRMWVERRHPERVLCRHDQIARVLQLWTAFHAAFPRVPHCRCGKRVVCGSIRGRGSVVAVTGRWHSVTVSWIHGPCAARASKDSPASRKLNELPHKGRDAVCVH